MINFSKRWSIAAIALAIVISMASLPLTSCDNDGGGGSVSVATPTASPPAGTYATAQTVTLSTTEGAVIYYTIDGTTPTTASTVYSGAISISATSTVKAIAVKEGNSSGVLTALYTISGGGAKTLVSISVTTLPTKIVYNIGETFDPAGMVVTATYSDATSEAVTGTPSGFDSSTAGNKTITVTYNGKTAVFSVNVINPELETVATPTASPEAGSYLTAQNVSLATTTAGAVIRYTTDGTTPTTASTLFSGAIPISVTTTVKAIAVKEGMNSSGVLEALYTIAAAPVITTTSLPNGNVIIPYRQQLAATGDTPITWTLDSGTLPIGFALSPEGVISGTPTSEGTSTFTVKATNSAGSNTKSLSIVINPSPTFDSIATFATWLAAQPTNTPASAYLVKLNVSSLGGSAVADGSLGKTLANNDGKYVSLDLNSSSITAIPEYTFNTGNPTFTGSTTLTRIIIPGSVTTIGTSAFRGCDNLNSLEIPNSVISIGNYAFSGCSKLDIVLIGSGVASIGDGAFTYCSSLTRISVHGENATFFASLDGVLYNKARTSLLVYPLGKNDATYIIPASVTSIGKMAFRDNDKITSITIPGTVATIEEQAFLYCVLLDSVTFEGAATVISSNSFEGGASLPTAYTAGGIGTYKRSGNGSAVPYTWAKQ